MNSDGLELRSDKTDEQKGNAGLINTSGRSVVKPEQDCHYDNQYVLADTGCGMVFLQKEKQDTTPI